jgi:TolA-binding protein
MQTVRLTKARRMVAMARWLRFFGIFMTVAGIISVALAQDPAEPPAPPQGQAPAQSGEAQPTIQPAPDADLTAEVQQLRSEVDSLKDQVAQLNSIIQQLQAGQAAPAKTTPIPAKSAPAGKGKQSNSTTAKKTPPTSPVPASVQSDEQPPLTVLVFQDGHRIEARNYAIVGQTLWVYTEDDSKKMPVSELDVAATKSANADRGIVFQLPPSR